MAEGGKLHIIETSSESDQDDTDHDTDKQQKEVPLRIHRFTITGLKAELLVKFFEKDLQNFKKDVKQTKKGNILEFSSKNPTLLATEEQRFDKLVNEVIEEKVDLSTCRDKSEIQRINQLDHFHSILLSFEEDNVRIFAKEKRILENFREAIQAEMEKAIKSSPNKKEVKRRRGREFPESLNPTESSIPVAMHDSHEEYESPNEWKRTTSHDNINGSSEMVDTSTRHSQVDLGRNTHIKLEIPFRNGLKTKIYKGSILHAKVDAIVNAANDRLNNCGGVAHVISQAAGIKMEQHCKKKLSKHGGKIKVTENVVTVGGSLPCKHVIHAVGPRWSDYRRNNKADCLSDLCLTVTNILNRACEYKLKCVVMPPISAGIFGVPKEACAAMYLRAIHQFSENDLKETPNKIREFHIVDIKDEMLDIIVRVHRHYDGQPKNFLDPSQVLYRIFPKYSKSDDPAPLLERNANTKQDDKCKNKQADQSRRIECSYKEVFRTTLNGKLQVQIYPGDITEVKNVDIIVSAEDRKISGQGMLAKTILEKAGDDYKKKHSGLSPSFLQKLFFSAPRMGEVLQTGAGTLNFKLVFHAIMRKFPNKKPSEHNLGMLWDLTLNILQKANEKPTCRKSKRMKRNCVSLAMPLLGTGSIESTEILRQYANTVFQCISDFSQNRKLSLTEIHLVNFSREVNDVVKEAFLKQSQKEFTKSGRPVYPQTRPHSPALKQRNKGHTKFDPSPYKLVEEWKASENKKEKIDQFVEPSRPSAKNVHKPFTYPCPTNKQNNPVPEKGNVNLIDSSEEESENETQNATAAHGATCESDYDNISDSENAFDRLGKESTIIQSTCVICMDDEIEDPVKLQKCHHEFCRECLVDYFSQKPACPVCNTVYSKLYGDQPEDGIATVYLDSEPLPGSFGHGTLIIHYYFPDGIQSQEHPSPGEGYTGLSRQAYLPDDDKGKKVLTMLRKAFEQRLTFTVGFSRTSGRDDVVTWNDIHHKTRRDGGPERYGYPDPDYLDRVTEELNAKGIFEE